jgi:cytochrome P450
VWPAPDKFDPGRFVVRDDDSPNKVRADLLHMNPFGGGASMCKGRLYADREVPFFVAAFLTVWEFRLEEGFRKPELVYWGSGTASPKTPVRARISRRAW